MAEKKLPFAVRLIGFTSALEHLFESAFIRRQGDIGSFLCLPEDSLQDPDFYVANGLNMRALAILSNCRCNEIRPGLLVGKPIVDMPFPIVQTPILWDQFFKEMDKLITKRADALSRLSGYENRVQTERRRHNRLDIDLSDPKTYQDMRHETPKGGVLVLDSNEMLSRSLDEILPEHLTVHHVSCEADALAVCQDQKKAVILINAATLTNVNPYQVCHAIKTAHPQRNIAVIFLVSSPFVYDTKRGREAGAEGFIQKPADIHKFLPILQKFLPRIN